MFITKILAAAIRTTNVQTTNIQPTTVQTTAMQTKTLKTAQDWYEHGQVLIASGDLPSALDAFRHSLKLNPNAAVAWIGLADVLESNQQMIEALECLKRGVAAEPDNAFVVSRMARALQNLGRIGDARKAYDKALSIDPSSEPALLGSGELSEDQGEPELAARYYRQLLEIVPNRAEPLANLLGLVKSVDISAEIILANKLMTTASERDAALIGYGLGKALDSQGKYSDAFSALSAANKARRKVAGEFDKDLFVERVDRMKTIFSKRFFQERKDWGCQSQLPVFIVGLPRSGTTLTEQIIASHTLCYGAGELPTLSDLATATPDRLGISDPPWPHCADRLSKENAEHLGVDYVSHLSTLTDVDKINYVVDKAPLNFWHLGLIAISTPNARIVHCSRNIRDNGLSIYSQNFNLDQRWSTDLGDIATYWKGYRELMNHWKEVSGLQIIDMQYEETVSNTEEQSRKLLSFLNLEWDSSVLEFYRNKRSVQTPSRWQVRQPIYQSSSARWKNYEAFLSPLTKLI